MSKRLQIPFLLKSGKFFNKPTLFIDETQGIDLKKYFLVQIIFFMRGNIIKMKIFSC